MKNIFTKIEICLIEKVAVAGSLSGYKISMKTDGEIPFPQIILRKDGKEIIVSGKSLSAIKGNVYSTIFPIEKLSPGTWQIQGEGCKKEEWQKAGSYDWVKAFGECKVDSPAQKSDAQKVQVVRERGGAKLYFGIHKHMHQPLYRAADSQYWDGEIDGIFGQRAGAYTRYIPSATRQYAGGQLVHAGLSTSWSGTLIEQLNRASEKGLCGGQFNNWNQELRSVSNDATKHGYRATFSAFGFFHPLMPLIPGRDIIKQIEWHREVVRSTFGIDPSSTLFPPETAFHVRMIPALKKAGITSVIYDSIHRYRSCKEYPYAGPQEGMLPPNPAEQLNPPVNDWLQLQNIWAGSRISPSLLRPEVIKYEDIDGSIHTIIGVPAERYIGNEDARGGYGALQYEAVLGQVYDQILATNSFDPKHPPFFLLHSDGDNYGGGTDSYYGCNTTRLVEWLKQDSRFELTTIDDYMARFTPDSTNPAHIEPGAWSGADNGDPQFRKWFSRYELPYSPDLNSWAILTALQNAVHTLEDVIGSSDTLDRAQRLMLTAETSCYWYWTGQEIWDRQVTDAANTALSIIRNELDQIVSSGKDTTGPTIFAPWVTPENPGGKMWGNNCLKDAPKVGTVHTFIHDISSVKRAEIVMRIAGNETRCALVSRGAYPSQTNPQVTSNYYTVDLPEGVGDIRYFIEAEDGKGNVSRGALERVFCA